MRKYILRTQLLLNVLTVLLFLTFSTVKAIAKVKVDLNEVPAALQKDLKTKFLSAEEVDESVLDEVINYVIIEQNYDYAEWVWENSKLKLNLIKAKKIHQINFTGNNRLSESELKTELGVVEKSNFHQDPLIIGADRIRSLYKEKGFPNTIVELSFIPIGVSEIDIQVKINEGPQTRVRSIEFVTDNVVLKSKLNKIAKKKIGDVFTDLLVSELSTDTRKMLSANQFYRTSIGSPKLNLSSDESAVDLVFTIDYADQFEMSFEGISFLNQSQASEILDLDNFYSSNPNIGTELAQRLKNHYMSLGYARADISADETPLKTNYKKKIVLQVAEGPRVKIKNIEIHGRFNENLDYYIQFLKEHTSPMIEKGYYVRADLDVGLKNLIIDRQNQGYLQSKLLPTRTIYSQTKDEITVIVNIDEGPLTILEKVIFEGNISFPEEALLKVVDLKNDEPLRLNKLEESLAKIRDFYKSQGFLEMNIENEKRDLVTYYQDFTRAHVKYKLLEGAKVIVGSVVIEGNSITKDYVISKELDFKTGDVLTPQNIEETISRLQRLGHFSSIDIRTLEERTMISRRTVIIRVQDRDPGLFNFGFGVNNERELTLRGYTGIAYRNIYGTGRGVSLRFEGNYNVADVKYLERKVTVGYLEPYLLDTRTRGRVSYTLSDSVSDFSSRKANQISQSTFSLEQDITSHVLVTYDVLSLAAVRTKFIDTDVTTSELNIGSTGPTLDIDFRDHPFNPTKGTFTRWNVEYGSPDLGSTRTIEYLRSIFSFTHYKSVYKPGWVIANSMRFGFLRNISPLDDGGVPYDKKGLILGGQSTIRGFQPGESFPNANDFKEIVANDLIVNDEYKLTTEAQMALIKSEIRFPVKGNIGGAVFYDGGAVWVKGVDFKDPYRDTVGVAFRYATPVGAVSLEWGWKLDRKEERHENQLPFHFSIGTF